MTPDQRTIAWSVAGIGSTYFLVDRVSESLPFGIPSVLAFTGHANKISLSPDGLRVIVVDESLQSFGEALRGSRLLPFGGVGEGSFSYINAAVHGTDDSITDPVVSANDKVLAYTRLSSGSGNTLWISLRASAMDPWPVGEAVNDCILQVRNGKKKSPLAISNDARTVFFRDEEQELTRIAYRTGVDQAFTTFRDLPKEILSAIPNGTCDRLYYTAAGTDALDLFEALPAP